MVASPKPGMRVTLSGTPRNFLSPKLRDHKYRTQSQSGGRHQ